MEPHDYTNDEALTNSSGTNAPAQGTPDGTVASSSNVATADAPAADAPAASTPVASSEAPTPNPAEGDTQRTKARAKRKRLIVGAGVLAVLALVCVAMAMFLDANPPDDWLEPTAKQGRYEGWDEKSIREDLDRQVEEGMMAVSVSSSIVFENGQAEGEARIENIPGNRVDQKVTITLDDTGEEVYASKALEPGTHIQTIRLSRDLEPGDYPATVMFTGYDRETHAQRGSAGVQVTIYVLN